MPSTGLCPLFLRLLIFVEWSVSLALGDNTNNNRRRCIETWINFYTINVPKDDTMIDNERSLNFQEFYVRDGRINNSNSYFNTKDYNDITDLFLNLPPMSKMYNLINMQNIYNHQ